MKKSIYKEIEIPESVEASIIGNGIINIKGPEGEITRIFKIPKIKLEKKDNKIFVGSDKATKTEKKKNITIGTRIQNMVKGVQNKYEYSLKICSSHFPMTAEVKDKEFVLKNFFGEKIPRKLKFPEGVETELKKEDITIKSHDKELAGQIAANLERLTRLTSKDRRIFQDGIYITSKPEKH